jgi:cyclophilin family peptidyl-prolyl cis-trans isomerase
VSPQIRSNIAEFIVEPVLLRWHHVSVFIMHWIMLVKDTTPIGCFALSTTHNLWLVVSTISLTNSFNRVIAGFVAQGGCPDVPAGFAYCTHLLEPEIRLPRLRHTRGAVGAGRDDNPQKLSASCQFYIVHSEDGLARLDGDYTVYGHVIRGMSVVDAIVAEETDESDAPLTPIPLTVRIRHLSTAEVEATAAGEGGTPDFRVGGGSLDSPAVGAKL